MCVCVHVLVCVCTYIHFRSESSIEMILYLLLKPVFSWPIPFVLLISLTFSVLRISETMCEGSHYERDKDFNSTKPFTGKIQRMCSDFITSIGNLYNCVFDILANTVSVYCIYCNQVNFYCKFMTVFLHPCN